MELRSYIGTRPMRRVMTLGVLCAVAAAGLLAAPATAGDTVRDTVPLRWTSEGAEYSGQPHGSVVDGSWQTTHAQADGTRMVVHTTGLRPGEAYTLWFTFFNHPEYCTVPPSQDRRCGLVDLFNPLADGSLVFGDGSVASADGVAMFSGFRPVNVKPEGEEQIAWGSGILTNPLGAEYQATLRSHGPYDPETYGDDQITTLDGGCHDGEKYKCIDDQASGFRAQG